jgi:hypothetical protein
LKIREKKWTFRNIFVVVTFLRQWHACFIFAHLRGLCCSDIHFAFQNWYFWSPIWQCWVTQNLFWICMLDLLKWVTQPSFFIRVFFSYPFAEYALNINYFCGWDLYFLWLNFPNLGSMYSDRAHTEARNWKVMTKWRAWHWESTPSQELIVSPCFGNLMENLFSFYRPDQRLARC